MDGKFLAAAKKVELPDWATHVAVSRHDLNKVEPCAWLDEVNDYVDEDPSGKGVHNWIGGYRKAYWYFFTREEVSA